MSKKIIIDAGGTVVKAFLVEGDKIIDSKKYGKGNFVTGFDAALESIKSALEELSEKDTQVAIFAAGWTNLSKDSKHFIKKELGKISNNISFDSDAALPLVAFGENTVAITLGTGTAIAHNLNGKMEILFGLGHLIKDPLSGYTLSQNIFFNVLSQGTDKQRKALFKVMEVEDLDELIMKVYDYPKKTTISDAFEWIQEVDSLSEFVDLAIKQEEIHFFNSEVVDLLARAEQVVLNGSVANLPIIHDVIQKYVKGKLVSSAKRDTLIINAAKNI